MAEAAADSDGSHEEAKIARGCCKQENGRPGVPGISLLWGATGIADTGWCGHRRGSRRRNKIVMIIGSRSRSRHVGFRQLLSTG